MSVIIRLQKLPLAANASDVRDFFHGLTIPEGNVHIVGGREGDAFIGFATDEDARLAMRLEGKKIKDIKVKLLLSSRAEMDRIIAQARGEHHSRSPSPIRNRRSRSRSPRRDRKSPLRSRSPHTTGSRYGNRRSPEQKTGSVTGYSSYEPPKLGYYTPIQTNNMDTTPSHNSTAERVQPFGQRFPEQKTDNKHYGDSHNQNTMSNKPMSSRWPSPTVAFGVKSNENQIEPVRNEPFVTPWESGVPPGHIPPPTQQTVPNIQPQWSDRERNEPAYRGSDQFVTNRPNEPVKEGRPFQQRQPPLQQSPVFSGPPPQSDGQTAQQPNTDMSRSSRPGLLPMPPPNMEVPVQQPNTNQRAPLAPPIQMQTDQRQIWSNVAPTDGTWGHDQQPLAGRDIRPTDPHPLLPEMSNTGRVPLFSPGSTPALNPAPPPLEGKFFLELSNVPYRAREGDLAIFLGSIVADRFHKIFKPDGLGSGRWLAEFHLIQNAEEALKFSGMEMLSRIVTIKRMQTHEADKIVADMKQLKPRFRDEDNRNDMRWNQNQQQRGDHIGGFQQKGYQQRGYQPRDDQQHGYQHRDDQQRGFQRRDDQQRGYQQRDDQQRGFQQRDDQQRGYQQRDDQQRDYQQRDYQQRGFQQRDDQQRSFQQTDDQQRGYQQRDEQRRGDQQRDEQRRGDQQSGYQRQNDDQGRSKINDDQDRGKINDDQDRSSQQRGDQQRGDQDRRTHSRDTDRRKRDVDRSRDDDRNSRRRQSDDRESRHRGDRREESRNGERDRKDDKPRHDKTKDEGATRQSHKPSVTDVCVLLSGLPLTITERDVAGFFDGLRLASNGIRLMKTPKGTAFVEFVSIDQCEKAVAKNGEYMGSQKVTVEPTTRLTMTETVEKQLTKDFGSQKQVQVQTDRIIIPPGPPSGTQPIDPEVVQGIGAVGCVLAVHQLPPNITLEEVCQLFEPYNVLEDTVRMHYNDQCQPTGDCLLATQSAGDAIRSVEQMHGKVMGGRVIHIYVVEAAPVDLPP